MTNMPVLDKNSGIPNLLSAKGTKPVSSPGENFDSVLKQTNGTKAESPSPEKKEKASNATEPAEETKGTALRDKLNGKDKAEETKAAETEKDVTGTEDIEEDVEALEKAGGEMAAALAAQLNIPEEAIREAMDSLQMSDVSLLQPENVKELMIHLTEGADNMSMLTDGEFYDSVTQALETLDSILEDAMKETGMDSGELKALAEQLDKQAASGEVPKQAIQEAVAEAVSDMQSAEDGKQENPVKFPAEKPELTENARTELAAPREASRHESRGSENSNAFAQDHFNFQNPAANTQMQAERMMEAESPLPTASPQEIMDQIMDYMKVSVKPELTDLQMQLHPESLGNLHIHISSREGALTAQFTAQNETVKAVLESQMMELKQNLEEQGVKVEAVEVTVAQYSLDREPEGDNASSEQGQKQKKGIRNLNVGELDLEDEELTEEEKLAAEMMKSEGSTISYMA